MNILISNDDGYQAPGILVLADALRSLGRVVIVAPDRNRSGTSSALTLTAPINAKKYAENVYAIEGTPADCVNVALGGLISFTPDIVVSGINDGPNLADDTLYSGTVAAAIEGRHLGLPAIAISMGSFHAKHYRTAGAMAAMLVKTLMQSPLPQDTILNVNVPDLPLNMLKGIVSTRLGSRLPPSQAAQHPNPRGQTMYWLGPAGEQNDNSVGTDFHAVSEGMVSVTPLTIDMTKHATIGLIQTWLDDIRLEDDAC